LTNGISISGIQCKKCGNYDHEMFGDNILVCTKCWNRIENPRVAMNDALYGKKVKDWEIK